MPEKEILVVEDEGLLARMLTTGLRRAGYAVRMAGSGEAALKSVRRQEPDLIILDVGLPKMTGLDFLERLRRDSAAPVILLSGRSSEADRLRGLKLGARDYLAKPFRLGDLIDRVAKALGRTPGAAAARAAR